MGEGRLTQAGWPVKQNMVERLASAFRCLYGNAQVFLGLILPDEIIQMAWPEADVQGAIFSIWFT